MTPDTDAESRQEDPAPVGLLDAYENFAGRHRFSGSPRRCITPAGWVVIAYLVLIAAAVWGWVR